MAFVAINVLSVPPGAGETLEQRFAGRAGMVDSSPGFERFELLRPIDGTSDYLVITHWTTEAHYQEWLDSRSFAAGHSTESNADGGASKRPPAASGSQIWTFEVVQASSAVHD